MRKTLTITALTLATAITLYLPTPALAQDYDDVEIRTSRITDSLYMLEGAGGNIGVCIGDDGVFIIDDQFAPLTDKIKAAIAELTDKPVQFVINTHYHYDHTDGNENFGGEGAIIVAHENSRTRMSADQILEAFDYLQEAYSPPAYPRSPSPSRSAFTTTATRSTSSTSPGRTPTATRSSGFGRRMSRTPAMRSYATFRRSSINLRAGR